MVNARRSVALALVFSLLLGGSASAIPIFGDPQTAYLLRVVANLLRTIQEAQLALQLVLQRRIDRLISDFAFPSRPWPDGSIFEPIDQIIHDVRSIRREVQGLSCSWVFSPRTALLRDTLLGPLKLCRPDFQLAWGTAEGHWDADQQEIQDFAATLTSNMVSERADAEESWARAIPGMEEATALLRRSPGEANRDEAVLLAAAGQIAQSNSALQTQKLLVEALDAEMERGDQRLALSAGLGLLEAVTCLDADTCARN